MILYNQSLTQTSCSNVIVYNNYFYTLNTSLVFFFYNIISVFQQFLRVYVRIISIIFEPMNYLRFEIFYKRSAVNVYV